MASSREGIITAMTKAKADERTGGAAAPRARATRVEHEDDNGDDVSTEAAAPVEKPRTARSAPPVTIPARVTRISGSPSSSVKALQVMLSDFGFFKTTITGYYGNETRNAVSDLQVQLREHGYYLGRPHGSFDEPTRQALERDPAFNTVS